MIAKALLAALLAAAPFLTQAQDAYPAKPVTIIVPYPHHRDRQQYFNGKVLEAAGGAVVIEQHVLAPTVLAAAVRELLEKDRLAAMGAAARALARADCARSIVEDLQALTARN